MSEKTNHDVKIQNVVAVASIGQNMDLMAIRKIFRNVEYRRKEFPSLVFRLKKPKTAIRIFKTGKMVCIGAKSERMAQSAVRMVMRKLREAGFIIKGMPKIEVVNIVGTADAEGDVDLEAAANVLDNIMYEPEQFPGLIYRMKEPKGVILIFRSGQMVLTGLKSEDKVHEAVEKIISILVENELLY